jgi:hypothetical protein
MLRLNIVVRSDRSLQNWRALGRIILAVDTVVTFDKDATVTARIQRVIIESDVAAVNRFKVVPLLILQVYFC